MSEVPQSFRVLVVDDDVRIADSLVQILTATGHQAVAAYSAEAAMKLAEKLNPEAMVSDVIMGPVSGIELTNHIREHYPDCRVLLFSGYASTKSFTEAFLARESNVQFLVPKASAVVSGDVPVAELRSTIDVLVGAFRSGGKP